jgi:hypothetical protein
VQGLSRAERGQHHAVPRPDEVEQLGEGHHIGGGELSGHATNVSMSDLRTIVSNMSSNNEVTAVLDAADDAFRALAALPFQSLRPGDQRAVLIRLDAMEKQLTGLQRRMLGRMVAAPPPVQFAGAPWAEVLARRLRISVGEAQRRIAEADGSSEPRSA